MDLLRLRKLLQAQRQQISAASASGCLGSRLRLRPQIFFFGEPLSPSTLLRETLEGLKDINRRPARPSSTSRIALKGHGDERSHR
jgi:hypothetical protein